MSKLLKYIGIVYLFALGLGNLTACSDEPRRVSESEEPQGREPGYYDRDRNPSDDADNAGESETGESGTETVQGIEGFWINETTQISFIFAADGSFKARADRTIGFRSAVPDDFDGYYTYNQDKNFLWLNVNGDNEIYVLEFRCVTDGDKMTLYGRENLRPLELVRKNGEL